MMNSIPNLMMDAAALAVMALSPSKTCRVRVSSTRYRNDPYRAKVMPSPFVTKTAVVVPPRALKPATETVKEAAPLPPVSKPHPLAKTAAPKNTTKTTAVKSPKAPAPKFALVGFKHETCMYQAPFRVAIGDRVVVEADRGEHVGVVVEISTKPPKYNVPSRIVRRVTPEDEQLSAQMRAREKTTTSGAQRLAESLGLGIKVVDTEFQIDGNKLTVFFQSKCFVDFRKLQRGLFREFRCRIWLVNYAEVRAYEKPASA